ncbi:MAG: hypothetical protein ABJP79_17795 [Tateyamaria sp.]|uniref:hypothetical protein n=1 Tax=Tateyamaria sp. TaxID=1929288 RepID=UPI0032A0AFB8
MTLCALLTGAMFVEAVANDDASDAVGAPSDSFDTFITSDGADVIEISYINASGAGAAMGLFGTVTDFDNTEEMILIDPRWHIRELDVDQDSNITEALVLREDLEGGFTDIDFAYTADATGESRLALCALRGSLT